jgi:hypothetical protein
MSKAQRSPGAAAADQLVEDAAVTGFRRRGGHEGGGGAILSVTIAVVHFLSLAHDMTGLGSARSVR